MRQLFCDIATDLCGFPKQHECITLSTSGFTSPVWISWLRDWLVWRLLAL